MSKKVDSVAIGFRWKKEVYETIKADADKNGVTLGAYLAMLGSQKHIEVEAMRLISAVPTERLRQMIMEQEGDPAAV